MCIHTHRGGTLCQDEGSDGGGWRIHNPRSTQEGQETTGSRERLLEQTLLPSPRRGEAAMQSPDCRLPTSRTRGPAVPIVQAPQQVAFHNGSPEQIETSNQSPFPHCQWVSHVIFSVGSGLFCTLLRECSRSQAARSLLIGDKAILKRFPRGAVAYSKTLRGKLSSWAREALTLVQVSISSF